VRWTKIEGPLAITGVRAHDDGSDVSTLPISGAAPIMTSEKTAAKTVVRTSVKSDLKETSTVERELAIVVPGDHVARELDRAYRELGEKVKLKGFRPGKIPRYVLEQYYKADTEQKVLERVVSIGFRDAVKEHSLEPVANPKIETVPELIQGMDFRFTAKVEVKPDIDIKKWKGLAITKTTFSVGRSDIDKDRTHRREEQARIAPVEGRDVIQQGDFVSLNWSGTVDGDHVKGLSGVNYTIEIGGGIFLYKDAEQALVGKKIDTQFTVDVKLPANFPQEAFRGKAAVFTMSPLAIKTKTLPALDDEFAKDVSDETPTLTALEERIEQELKTLAERKTKSDVQEQAATALIESNPFEVPSALVERQAEQVAVERLQRMPKQQAEMLWQMQSARMKEDAKPIATRQVRLSLLLEKLCKMEKVDISESELNDHYEKLAADFGSTVKVVKDVYKKNRRHDELKFQLQTQRMLEKVIAAGTIAETQKSVLD
jgi:trigger factor